MTSFLIAHKSTGSKASLLPSKLVRLKPKLRQRGSLASLRCVAADLGCTAKSSLFFSQSAQASLGDLQSQLVELKRRVWESDAEAQQQCVHPCSTALLASDCCVRSLGKIAELNAAVQSAEARAKDATDTADKLLRECDRLNALLRERDGSDVVRHLHEWPGLPPHMAMPNGGAWPAGQLPWPGPPPMMAPPPLPLPLHGHHDAPFIPTPVAFGDFPAFIPPPPGFQPGQGVPRAPLPVGVATSTPPAQAPPAQAHPAHAAAENAPPPMEEGMLVSIFSRAAPQFADPTVTPDVLLARVEASFLRPHSWVPHYSNRYGSVRDFILAHPEEFAVTGEGCVFRRPRTPPLQMMITPLPPPVQGGLTFRDGSKPATSEPTIANETSAPVADQSGNIKPSNRGRASGQPGGRGRKPGGGRGGGRPEF